MGRDALLLPGGVQVDPNAAPPKQEDWTTILNVNGQQMPYPMAVLMVQNEIATALQRIAAVLERRERAEAEPSVFEEASE